MRIKRHDDGGPTEIVRQALQLFDESRVPEVDAIEIANRQGAPPNVRPVELSQHFRHGPQQCLDEFDDTRGSRSRCGSPLVIVMKSSAYGGEVYCANCRSDTRVPTPRSNKFPASSNTLAQGPR